MFFKKFEKEIQELLEGDFREYLKEF